MRNRAKVHRLGYIDAERLRVERPLQLQPFSQGHQPYRLQPRIDLQLALGGQALEHDHCVELIVLARSMQILSDILSDEWRGSCINTHHSFPPGFKGGSPYARAHSRGVKMMGATARYVTGDLDEGPITEQDVRRIGHRYSVADMQAMGRDVESHVLSNAVRMHLEDRIIMDGNKTIVFR